VTCIANKLNKIQTSSDIRMSRCKLIVEGTETACLLDDLVFLFEAFSYSYVCRYCMYLLKVINKYNRAK